jgi:hypothetical protein
MQVLAIAALFAGGLFSGEPDVWRCRNDIEIWCAQSGCRAAPEGAFTPLDVELRRRRGFTLCAYTGCWESKAPARRISGRLVWTANAAPFSTARAGEMATDVTIVYFPDEGVGFVRAGGLATPVICAAPPKE